MSAAGRWADESVVAGFAKAAPNQALLDYARAERKRRSRLRVLDLGCGAARNAAPLAAEGTIVIGLDLARPMLLAAGHRARGVEVGGRLALLEADMAPLPLCDACVDLIVAHGIWNLARSGAAFRQAVAEAARVARPQAGLFVFTFSRATLPDEARPVPGESFVFTQFSGEPQCFLTEDQLVGELARAGFEKDPPGPLTVHNRPAPGRRLSGGPVIYEGTFRRR